MRDQHITEEEIQQYATDAKNCEPGIRAHIDSCEGCKAKAAEYRLLFAAIRQQPAPAFAPGLADQVLARIPGTPQSRENLWIALFVAAGILLTGIAGYFLRPYLATLLANMAKYAVYLALTTVTTLLIVLCFDMYKRYQKKMRLLEFH